MKTSIGHVSSGQRFITLFVSHYVHGVKDEIVLRHPSHDHIVFVQPANERYSICFKPVTLVTANHARKFTILKTCIVP